MLNDEQKKWLMGNLMVSFETYCVSEVTMVNSIITTLELPTEDYKEELEYMNRPDNEYNY